MARREADGRAFAILSSTADSLTRAWDIGLSEAKSNALLASAVGVAAAVELPFEGTGFESMGGIAPAGNTELGAVVRTDLADDVV